jgi:signal transduction histidine kinase
MSHDETPDCRTVSRATVLAVDDTPANLIALEALLGPLGCAVMTASSGLAAIELAREYEFAVILLDVMMPGLDGFETLQRLRSVPTAKTTPVIFLTARSLDRASFERAYALGAIDYITKPLEPLILQAKVRAFIALFEQGQEIKRQAEALRAKDKHLGVLAHDLRTPLSVVTTAARLAHHADPSVQVAASRLARAGHRMQSLSNDLLETARMALSSLRFERAPLSLHTLLDDLTADFEALYPEVTFERSWPLALEGSGDRLRLQQALTNLLTNAVKYGTGWVGVRATAQGERMRIDVTNHCPAQTPEQIGALFAAFTQGSERKSGVGLGLYIVREIARLHGGDAYGIWQDGRITFSMEFALEEAAVSDASAERPLAPVTQTRVRTAHVDVKLQQG